MLATLAIHTALNSYLGCAPATKGCSKNTIKILRKNFIQTKILFEPMLFDL
jgi:hypothetical protein